ncbi:hypothetical protein GGX14DRAFT_594740 [Mycena pura]|uniref:Uncharacterized protein n=1 Tax=Mycena pura TaxID=153505 RepID=A0AAD6VNJ6_9AGAR|nr:hypothetical protein GGX14DRAFT_594740 [Mycena pura]
MNHMVPQSPGWSPRRPSGRFLGARRCPSTPQEWKGSKHNPSPSTSLSSSDEALVNNISYAFLWQRMVQPLNTVFPRVSHVTGSWPELAPEAAYGRVVVGHAENLTMESRTLKLVNQVMDVISGPRPQILYSPLWEYGTLVHVARSDLATVKTTSPARLFSYGQALDCFGTGWPVLQTKTKPSFSEPGFNIEPIFSTIDTCIWILNIYDPCHNLNLFLKDLGQLFNALAAERERQGIKTAMKSASETRFGSTFIQTVAVQLCMPALGICVRTGAIKFATAATKRLIPYLMPGPVHYGFLAQLDLMVKLFKAGANGITTLEGQNRTCADVFYVWVTIAWHLETP